MMRERRWLIIENVWSGNPKKKKLWQGNNVAQPEYSNNKYYALTFRCLLVIGLCFAWFFYSTYYKL